MLIAEMLAIHFCSDQDETIGVVRGAAGGGRRAAWRQAGRACRPHAVRVYWVNPVADLRVMNLLEDLGGRVCGTEYLFCHALDPIPEDLPPLEALARTALADPMVGSPADGPTTLPRDRRARGRGRGHFADPRGQPLRLEGPVIAEVVRERCGIPVLEIEVPPITDSIEPSLRTRLEALVETTAREPRIEHGRP